MNVNWSEVMTLVEGFIKAAGSVIKALRGKCKELPPGMGYGHVWFNPETKQAWVSLGDWEEHPEDWRKPLASVKGVKDVRIEAECSPPDDEPWVRIKCGHSPALRTLAQLTNLIPGPTNAPIGGPSPLAATLTGGLLGAGTGYGAGYVGEQVMPDEQFRPGHLRHTLAALGGLAGAAPGLLWGLESYRHHPSGGGLKSLVSSWPFRKQDAGRPAHEKSQSMQSPPGLEYRPGVDIVPPGTVNGVKIACEAARALLGEANTHYKQALGEDGDYGMMTVDRVPMIPADQFTQTVWQDQQTPMNVRAATTGLVDSASTMRGVRIVSPADIARIGVGMGAGYLSGLFVGKTLGALAGLRPGYCPT
jgi:hypothetical protein